MKNIIIAAALTVASILPTMAQAPATEVKAPSSNELALKVIGHFKTVFTLAANASTEEEAKKAATAIETELSKLSALKPLLEKAKAPTEADMEALAEQVVPFESEMKAVMTKMMQNSMTAEPAARKLLEEPMKKFGEKSTELGKIMESLYPDKKMKPLVEAAKAKLKAEQEKKEDKPE